MFPDLIFDVGAHNGDDTAYYLWRGYRVVAVEANPSLAERLRQRFATEIATQQLFLEGAGISDHIGTQQFWVNEVSDQFSSFEIEYATKWHRPEFDGKYFPVEVPVITFDHLLEKYGSPFYLKSDIEGYDLFVLRQLNKNDLPAYVSFEAHRLSFLSALYEQGYREFKIISQREHAPINGWTFEPGSSGPFGEEALGDWENFETIAYKWLHYWFKYDDRGPMKQEIGWYDIHARRSVLSKRDTYDYFGPIF